MLPDTSVDQFRDYLARVNNDNTAAKYRLAAEKFVGFCAQQHLSLDRLPPGVLSLFSETLSYGGLSPSSVKVMTAGARRYLKWLQSRGAIPTTVFSAPDLPRIVHEPPTTLRDEDLVAFFQNADRCPEPARTALFLLPYCGLRCNELTSLTLRSLRRVEVPTADGHRATHICLYVRGKGGDYRTVPILHDGLQLLMQYLKKWRGMMPGEWLFPMSDGEPISNRTVRHYTQWVRERMKRQGRNPDRLTPHALRRTYITTLWKSGLDVLSLTKIAGHKNVQTTMNHYLEVTPEDLAGKVGGTALIPRGEYADAVRLAQSNVHEFLASMNVNAG